MRQLKKVWINLLLSEDLDFNWWLKWIKCSVKCQSDGISMKNWLKPSLPAFYIWYWKKTMRMTWLHMEFVLISCPANGRALWQLCRPKCLLTLTSLVHTRPSPHPSQKYLILLCNLEFLPFPFRFPVVLVFFSCSANPKCFIAFVEERAI